MADKKISELTNITGANLADADEFVVVDTSASETKAITRSELVNGLVTASTVTSAGALMDSELTDITAVKALNQGVATTDDPTFTNTQLAAIAETKAVTAVDVFVYDTSKDSDGGAWRKRTQHTSWYNETLNTATRGSRREFPAVAVIVAESNKVTIYDGDDPSLPMWMVFFQVGNNHLWRIPRPATCVSMRNSILAVGLNDGVNIGTCGVILLDFVADSITRHSASSSSGGADGGVFPVGIAGRHTQPMTASAPVAALVNSFVNDVAMTVLPDAPIDPATGLPVPTIAVATGGGVSVIKDDGTVVDSADTDASYSVSFNSAGYLIYPNRAGQNDVNVVETYASDGFSGRSYSEISIPATNGQVNVVSAIALNESAFAIQGSVGGGITVIQEDPATPTKGMANYTTSTYNTGWMNGDIKGAFLSDTDDTDLVGSGELVTNGTFDTDTSGWSAVGVDGGTDTTFSWNASGYMEVTRGVGGVSGRPEQGFTTVVGETYTISVDVVTAQRAFWTVGSSSGSNNLINTITHVGNTTVTRTFVATSTTSYVGFWPDTSATTGIDNISVKLADADRSVNNNGLIVNGAVTRSPVATGAELVAYSGFTNSNYLEQPYNSDLDFGTGDFCVMGWVKVASDTWGMIVDRYTGSSGRFSLGYTPSGSSAVAEFNINVHRHQGTTLLGSTWRHVTLVRSSGVASLYVDGVLDASFSRTEDVTSNTSAPLIIGKRYDNVQQADQGALLALCRISATAPTAEQIKKIYEDEKVLFQENAAATLYGASDAVTALAHDSDTGLLHVGTSAGRSVFQGLRRVSNTTTAVGTAISAANGLIAEE